MSDEAILKKFGKFFLLDRIGEGGMAEIYRARLADTDGAQRILVIKRIQSALSQNPEFLQMFRAEVQVTMRFTHPNIVQLYESGEADGMQFIAMEYVDGKNLRQIQSRLSRQGGKLPIPAVAYLMEQVALGLHYAHHFRDRITGEALNLVHRDVSPQNLLVSYDGNIKVIDFGIAKASTTGEHTRAGVIKGKLSYLSPEQVLGNVLDGRSDLFSLGIVFWEALTGKRLFVSDGENEFQILKMIDSCDSFVKPPSSIRSDVPKEVDAIVMRMLKRDPNARFQTGEELAKAIRKVLVQFYSDFSASDLSHIIKKIFHDQIVEDRKWLNQIHQKAETLLQPSPESQSGDLTQTKVQVSTKENPPNSKPLELIVPKEGPVVKMEAYQPFKVDSPSKKPAKSTPPRMDRSMTMELNKSGQKSGIGKWVALILAAVGGYLGYVYQFDESHPFRTIAQVKSDSVRKPSEKIQGESVQKMKVRLSFFPKLSENSLVMLNQQKISPMNGVVEIEESNSISLSVNDPKMAFFQKDLQKSELLQKDGIRELSVKLEPGPEVSWGELSLKTQPGVCQVILRNKKTGDEWETYSPIYQERVPVGDYEIQIKSSIREQPVVKDIQIKKGEILPLDIAVF